MDLFICGICREEFNDILQFMEHKKFNPGSYTCSVCNAFYHTQQELLEHAKTHSLTEDPKTTKTDDLLLISNEKENAQTILSNFQIVYAEAGSDMSHILTDNVQTIRLETAIIADANDPQDVQPSDHEYLPTRADLYMCTLCNNLSLTQEDLQNHFDEVHQKVADDDKDEPKMDGDDEKDANKFQIEITDDKNKPGMLQLMVKPKMSPTDSSQRKKRGRPKKSLVPKETENTKNVKDNVDVLKELLVNEDGKLQCSECKRTFTKERHFKGHRCWGSNGDYVDISKESAKETLGEPIDDDDEDVDSDRTKDFKVYQTVRKQKLGDVSETCPITIVFDPSVSDDIDKEELNASSNVPVFKTEEQRLAFEEKIKSVDLTCLDRLFMKHLIQQSTNADEHLEVYSCKVCKKVFKTIAHMRLHCLIHTDLKPFKCPECDYASNSKGNLYTHMRKHTGNFFRCLVCNFKTCNKTHLVEHCATHTNERHTCKICNNDYNTVKSLQTHIRKYHRTTTEGKEYLKTFLLKTTKTAAILHQCHVCNRKFKKKLDRDRHLFTHDERHVNTLKCGLCDYVLSRKGYLNNHFKRHRMVYVCSVCATRFLSSVRLREHVVQHVPQSESQSIEDDVEKIFEDSIDVSLFLPEPNEVFEIYKHAEIPEELKEPKETSDVTKEAKDVVINGLEYKPMTLAIFKKITQTFGREECETCGRRFHAKCDADLHRHTHNSEKPQKCLQCDYSTVTKDNLKRHVEAVHEKKKYECGRCDFLGLSRTTMWHHQNKKHKNVSECPTCKENFEDSKALLPHILDKHPDLNPNLDMGLSSKLQNRLGRRSYKCPYCEKVFCKSNTDLQKHIWIHEGKKPFKCPSCSYACRSRNNLNVHMLRHSTCKPHLCEECGKAYKSKTALRFHVRAHSEGLTFACDKCNYSGSQKSHLKRHMETHNVIKRFQCRHCKYSSNTLAVLKVHYARKHKDETLEEVVPKQTTDANGKVFKCINCDFVFGNFSDLKRHLKSRHRMTDISHMKEWDSTAAIDDTPPISVELQPAVNDGDDDTFRMIRVKTVDGIQIARISKHDLQELEMMETTTSEDVNVVQDEFEAMIDPQELVAINPESVIVQEEIQEVVVESSGNEFVIQYLAPALSGDDVLGTEQSVENESSDFVDNQH